VNSDPDTQIANIYIAIGDEMSRNIILLDDSHYKTFSYTMRVSVSTSIVTLFYKGIYVEYSII